MADPPIQWNSIEDAESTYVVNYNCIRCKTMDCVEVCPVDCFYEGENMLVIDPDECIDCGVCEPECPVDAIKADTELGSAMDVIDCGTFENLAKYSSQKSAPARLEGVGGEAGQTPTLLDKSRRERLTRLAVAA